MSRIVVISAHDDAHLPFVQRHLHEELFVIDPEPLLKAAELSYSIGDSVSEIRYDGTILRGVRSIWYRKPSRYEAGMLPQVDERFRDYAVDSLQAHFNYLRTAFPGALPVSDFYAMARAEQKPLQYRVAGAYGLRVPDTVLTNDVGRAHRLIARHDKVVVKRTGHIAPAGMMFPTTIIDDTTELDNLHLAPALFQQAIVPKRELRITVVGRRSFVAAIDDAGTQDRPDVRDWRMSQFTDKHLKFYEYNHMPDAIRRACLSMVKELGLQFGAIDIIVDQDDRHWFLEINPNGQWAFVERDTGLPIGKAMADLLSGRADPL